MNFFKSLNESTEMIDENTLIPANNEYLSSELPSNKKWYTENFDRLLMENKDKIGQFCLVSNNSIVFLGTCESYNEALQLIKEKYSCKKNCKLFRFAEHLKIKESKSKKFDLSDEFCLNFGWLLNNYKQITG